jgi:phosphoribosylglycinamide formyltransferase 1
VGLAEEVRVGQRAALAVLISGSGTNLQAAGLRRARDAGIATFVAAPGDYPNRSAWNQRLADELERATPDWIISAGFMRLLGPAVLDRFPNRIVNTHPALLPSFPGAHAVREALAYGVSVTGCTVHLIDSGIDTGPILAQASVDVHTDDDEDSLHERIKTVERRLLVDVVQGICEKQLTIDGRKVSLS